MEWYLLSKEEIKEPPLNLWCFLAEVRGTYECIFRIAVGNKVFKIKVEELSEEQARSWLADKSLKGELLTKEDVKRFLTILSPHRKPCRGI